MSSAQLTNNPDLQFQRYRDAIDDALDRHTQFGDGCPEHLSEAIRYSLLGPGKRLRPLLVLLAAEACGGTIDQALPAACAVEMVHAYSLVHDDLPAMDDDDLRRGRPTCHRVYGEDVAILVGDSLLARAFEVLSSEIDSAERAALCCQALASAASANALVGGQAADLAGQDQQGDLEELQFIHQRKTGALFVAALKLGGLTAGATVEQLKSLEKYGQHLGLAFQIVDDLLDVSGDQEQVGKRLGKDSDRGKVTFPSVLGVESSRLRAEQEIEQAVEALDGFDRRAELLITLAHFVVRRNK